MHWSPFLLLIQVSEILNFIALRPKMKNTLQSGIRCILLTKSNKMWLAIISHFRPGLICKIAISNTFSNVYCIILNNQASCSCLVIPSHSLSEILEKFMNNSSLDLKSLKLCKVLTYFCTKEYLNCSLLWIQIVGVSSLIDLLLEIIKLVY